MRLAFAATIAVALGYQLDRPLRIRLGTGFLDARVARGLYGAEEDFRWTGEQGAIVVPEPGPRRRARVEVDLQAWRPRGEKAPQVWVEAGGARVLARPITEPQTVSLETTTSGLWSSDLDVRVRSEVFTPGGGDDRPLGVRVRELRLLPLHPGWGLRGVPLRPLVLTALLVPLLFTFLARTGAPSRAAFALGLASAVLAGIGFALARAHAAAAVLPVLVAMAALEAVPRFAPGPCRVLGQAVTEAGRAFTSGMRSLWSWPALVVAVGASLAVVGAYLTQPLLVIDPTSRAGAAVLLGLGSQGGDDTQRFRHLRRGSAVDLRDFGSGPSWRVRASLDASRALPRPLALLRVGAQEATSDAAPPWTTVELAAASPAGLHSGLVLEFPAAALPIDLRLLRIEVDRGKSLPSPYALICVLGAAFLLAGAMAIAGAGPPAVWSTAAVTTGVLVLAVRVEPLATVPFLPAAFGIAGAAALFSALSLGVARLARGRGTSLIPPHAALAAAALGFAAFWATTAYPLYRGGHFVFHSSIAEEIWHGRFLLFYLPYPGSVLSHQAQWTNLIVPHPCLYQTLVSPLAAFPREWFYFLEKGVLAFLLAGNVLVTSLLALRVGGERSAIFAAALAASIPASYQLLGLGHLMTILGVWAFALAFAYLALRFDALPERRTLFGAAALLTLCFLSYFAGLLFALVVLGSAAAGLRRTHPGPVRALLVASALAAVAAFALYYVHWTWPFLSQSVPRFVSRATAQGATRDTVAVTIPLFRRLVRITEQLQYTFGTSLVPILGLLGLGLAHGRAARTLLVAWGGDPRPLHGVRPVLQFPAQAPLLHDRAGSGRCGSPARDPGRANPGRTRLVGGRGGRGRAPGCAAGLRSGYGSDTLVSALPGGC